MNKKYKKYIDYIVSDIEKPYFINMRDHYGLSPDECVLVLSSLYDQPVTIKDNSVYDSNGNNIYYEYSDGYWSKREYDINGNKIYYEYSDGYWSKREYDNQGNRIYTEHSDGSWVKQEYDINSVLIYYEDSDGVIEDNR